MVDVSFAHKQYLTIPNTEKKLFTISFPSNTSFRDLWV